MKGGALAGRLVTGMAATLAILSLVQCGGSPTKNSGVNEGPRVTGVSLSPTADLMKVGAAVDLSLRVTYSNGTTEQVTGTWTSSNTAVAQVTNGRVTAAGPGEAQISAQCQHGTASMQLRVVPDYQGTWAGNYMMNSCSADGDMGREGTCEIFEFPSEAPMSVRLNQNRTDVTGSIAFGTLMGDVQGKLSVPGNLDLSGSLRYTEDGVTVTITLADWNTLASGTRMTGQYVQVWTVTGATGSMRINCELRSITQTSQALRPFGISSSAGTGVVERMVRSLVRRR